MSLKELLYANGQKEYYITGVLMALVMISLIRTAWLCDDAYITFTTIDNWFSGYGLTGNITHRVAAYTHPLWMLTLAGAYYVTHEFYFTTVLLSIGLSFMAVFLAIKNGAISIYSSMVGLTLFLTARSFIEYSTSGLEGPLAFLLLAIWWLCYLLPHPEITDLQAGDEWSIRKPQRKALASRIGCGGLLKSREGYWWLARLTFIAGLIGLVRFDLLLLVGPLLAYAWWCYWQEISKSFWLYAGVFTVGMLPVWSWSLFSLIYYGFPIPNTAYAKLFAIGVDRMALGRQGVYYIFESLRNDPVMLIVIVGMILYAWWSRRVVDRIVMLGVLLYVGYIVRIGGDYMSGRFLVAPFFVSVLLLVRIPIKGESAAVMAMLAIVASLISPWPLPVLSEADFSNGNHYYYNNHGISNERSYIYQRSGLLSKVREVPRYGWAFGYRGEIPRTREVIPDVTGGIVALDGGPGVVYIDDMGLTDALIARLPIANPNIWRIGHFKRIIPQGYVASVSEDKNLIGNASLNEYYEAIKTITTGPLFTATRWKMIWLLNTGKLNHWVDEYAAVSAI